MNFIYFWLVLVVGIVLQFIYFFKEEPSEIRVNDLTKHHYNIVLGVLSSREHFALRSVIRDGIKRQSSGFNILVRFIVGQYPCRIPLEDRIDAYHCRPTSFLKPSADHFYFHFLSNSSGEVNVFVPHGPIGFDFVVNHAITVRSFGIFDHNSDGFKGIVKVLLYETPTRNEIVSATFLPFGDRGTANGMHVYKHGNEVILPKGFRGTIVIEGSTESDPLVRSRDCQINDGGGLITHISGYRYGNTKGTFPEFANHYITSCCYCVGPSFIYSSHTVSVSDNGTLLAKGRKKRYDDLRVRLYDDDLKVQSEQELHRDLLFVDVEESYRNLPQKMLRFYEWVKSESFDYVMKTDDDCYVNITGIFHFLSSIPIQRNIWIGNFRRYFPLDMHGKWAEHEYTSLTYPPFACGSGYLLSRDIVTWICMNRHFLYSYQGEDVSLGIWLASINPTIINERRFFCAGEHDSNILSSPENNLTFLKYLYDVG